MIRRRFENLDGTSAEWADKNPILLKSEIGVEEDTGRFKIGNGVLPWLELPYFIPSSTGESLEAHINDETPHPIYDDGPSLALLYENAKV